VIDKATLDRFVAESDHRTLHRLDVRTPEEFAAGHPQGFASAPGGQLVQATDEWVAVRGSRIVLFDDDGVRARMTASWLVQMGWDAFVVAEGVLAAKATGEARETRKFKVPAEALIAPVEFDARRGALTVLDLARSPAYRKGHIPHAWHVSGPNLARDIAGVTGSGPIVLTSPDGVIAAANFADARAATSREVLLLAGGTNAYSAAGFQLETGADHWLAQPDDVYKRPYEGTDNAREAMQGYIDWELQLVAQLANDGVAGFHVVR
jgi:rhodanese-related sulfurtransferase